MGGDGEGGGEEDEGRRAGGDVRLVWGVGGFGGGRAVVGGEGAGGHAGRFGGEEEKGGGVLDEHVWECLGGVSKNRWIAVVGWQRSRPLRGHQARSRFIGGTVVRRTISLFLKKIIFPGNRNCRQTGTG